MSILAQSIIGINPAPSESQQTTAGVTIMVQSVEQIAGRIGRATGLASPPPPPAAPAAAELAQQVAALPEPRVLPMWAADP